MMCYRDRWWCNHWEKCADTCERALTPEVQRAADKWWGGEGAPIDFKIDEPKCITKCITVWERFDEKSDTWKHNHIDDAGWVKGIAPIAKSPEQKKSWKNAQWRSILAYLKNDKVITKFEDTQ